MGILCKMTLYNRHFYVMCPQGTDGPMENWTSITDLAKAGATIKRIKNHKKCLGKKQVTKTLT